MFFTKKFNYSYDCPSIKTFVLDIEQAVRVDI